MALIKCPECRKDVSDKADKCIHCGFPLSEYIEKSLIVEENVIKNDLQITDEELEQIYLYDPQRIVMVQKVSEITGCSMTTAKERVDLFWNKKFPQKELIYTPQKEIVKKDNRNPKHVFTGIYKYSVFGKAEEVYCPRCCSENCSHYKEQRVVNSKARATVNLNPLRPFTLFNIKQKQKNVTLDKIICNDCGMIFQ